jgi:hypothetical protein
MGNALSPFLANIYTINLGTQLKQINSMVGVRYVDEIFSAISRRKGDDLL